MRNIDSLKKKLLKSIRFDSESYFKRMSTGQMMSLYRFFLDASDDNYYFYVIEELRAKREKLTEDKWPSQLKGDDWEKRLRKEYGLPPLPEVKTHPKETSIKKEEIAMSEQLLREEEKPKRVSDPFRSDGFGTLQGEPLDGDVPLVNRVRIRG